VSANEATCSECFSYPVFLETTFKRKLTILVTQPTLKTKNGSIIYRIHSCVFLNYLTFYGMVESFQNFSFVSYCTMSLLTGRLKRTGCVL